MEFCLDDSTELGWVTSWEVFIMHPLLLLLLLSLISSPISLSYFISLNLAVPSPHLSLSLLGWASAMLANNVMLTV